MYTYIYVIMYVSTRILVIPERSAHAQDMANILPLPHLTNTCGPFDVPFATLSGVTNLRGLSCTVITPHGEEGKTNLNVGMDSSLEDCARTLTR